MRIDPLDNKFLGPIDLSGMKDSSGTKNSISEKKDSVERTLDTYIARALSLDSSNKEEIARIRQEIDSGQMDSPEAFRATAEKMLNYGI